MQRAAVVFVCLLATAAGGSAALSPSFTDRPVDVGTDARTTSDGQTGIHGGALVSDGPGARARTVTADAHHATDTHRFDATNSSDGAPYRLVVADSVAVPSRTVEAGGARFRVDAIARGDPGGTLDARVTVPADEPYRLYLYDGNRRIVTGSRGEGRGTTAVGLDGVSPGTYVLTLSVDGVNERAVPVVVRGYAVSLAVPRSVPRNGSLRATVRVDRLRDPEGTGVGPAPNATRVELVLASDTDTRRVDATPAGEGRHAATVDAATLVSADYRAYANVRGREKVSGRRQLLGVSDASTVTIGDPNATGTTERPPTPSPSTSSRASPARSPRPSTPTTDGSVITPNAPQSTSPASSTDGSRAPIPNRGPALLAALLAAAAGLLAVRRRG